jgi:hypothetical protein
MACHMKLHMNKKQESVAEVVWLHHRKNEKKCIEIEYMS